MVSSKTKKQIIYVLLDFSEYSKTELLFAKSWIENREFEIRALHQFDFIYPTLLNNDLRLKIAYDQKRVIWNKWFQLKNEIFPEEIKVQFEILDYSLVEYLSSAAQNETFYLIMGLKGGGKMKQIFIGSMVNEVIKKLNLVTFALPKKLENFNPRKITITVHPEFSFNLKALEEVLVNAPKSVDSIKWVSIAREEDNPEDLSDYLDYLIKKVDTSLHQEFFVFSGEDTFVQVKAFFHSHNDNILLVQKGGRTFKDKLFRKFLINELVYDGSIPLIILPI
ncbi:universal stress protein [Shivajiella indica]|uniref:Universal stress protein n=1 Tax=Shivajiella indica TaxID=872115 RepID=A0ABW5B3N4_9BACT